MYFVVRKEVCSDGLPEANTATRAGIIWAKREGNSLRRDLINYILNCGEQ